MESGQHDSAPEHSADREDDPPGDDPKSAEWITKMITAAERAGYRLHPHSNPPHSLLWQRVTDDPNAEPVWADDLPEWLR
ncbi:hypothetical protein [Nocardia terpenica]|uniref:Uncharacterized protein n=1 Tax=Nocardia terpenica TaxID=455432 RepID=A0A164P0R2_9NOCA|nr:hypothetical protein [Nocardia terpenica]KZM74962.1 hypothetical protein AWN90_23410 [Nocardia terpenica]NQE93377.1 hypothetical protein [Nocardia terpenica]